MTYLRLVRGQDAQMECVRMLKEELEHACLYSIVFFLVAADLFRYETVKLFKGLNFHGMGRFFFATLDIVQEVSYTLVTLMCFWRQEKKIRLQFSVPLF